MRFVGTKVPRTEDRRLLTGRGRFIDDIQLPRMLHAAFLRSQLPHARITSIDTTHAKVAPGVVAVLTGEDLASVIQPMPLLLAQLAAPVFHCLATDRVRFVGDPVAIVVANTRHEAEDAAERIEVSYEQLPPIAHPAAALAADAEALFDDLAGNLLKEEESSFGDVDAAFAAADRVIELTFRQGRVAPMPMETRGAVADYDPGFGKLTLHCSVQTPSALRFSLGGLLGLSADSIRVVVPEDMGGAFGLKSTHNRETFAVAAASRALGRPVKWMEDRYEHLLASGQAREEDLSVQAAVRSDGTLLGLKAELTVDQGAYPSVPFPAPFMLGQVETMLPGPYQWQGYAFKSRVAVTNKASYVAYRGPWEVETWVRERLLDEVARALAMDPVQLRRINVVAGGDDDRMISGPTLAGLTTQDMLARISDLIDYDEFRREQREALAAGRHLGIGIATFIESAPGPPDLRAEAGPYMAEAAKVRLESDGCLVVVTAQVPHGQSHETTLAQVAADEMGIPFDHVRVLHGDSDTAPFKLIGTGGSMAATWASGAVRASTRRLREKVLDIAGGMLEISAGDLEITDGTIGVRGDPSAPTVPLDQIAMMATLMPDALPPGTDSKLAAEERFVGEDITGSGWAAGTHACTVEVDLDTGQVKILRYVVIEDCGRLINPAIVDGQIRGGVAQGIGEVLYERAAYDEDANFMSSTFMDYLVPTAVEIPTIEIVHLEPESDEGVGFRGVGEGGAIVAPATLGNAIADALAPLGGLVLEQPLTPARILELAGVIEVDAPGS